MTRRSPALNDECPDPYAEISPEDAQALKITDGDEIEVRSRRGQVKIKAYITDRVMPGLIFIPFHFAEAAANILTHHFLDPVAKNPAFKVGAVAIKRNNVRTGGSPNE